MNSQRRVTPPVETATGARLSAAIAPLYCSMPLLLRGGFGRPGFPLLSDWLSAIPMVIPSAATPNGAGRSASVPRLVNRAGRPDDQPAALTSSRHSGAFRRWTGSSNRSLGVGGCCPPPGVSLRSGQRHGAAQSAAVCKTHSFNFPGRASKTRAVALNRRNA